MQPKQSLLPFFFFFFILSLLVFFISSSQIFGFGLLGNALFPVEGAVYHLMRLPFSFNQNTKLASLQAQNQALEQKVSQLEQLQADNKALRDQFETTSPSSRQLLPAKIIGMPSFVPGILAPEALILDKGSSDGINPGKAVVYKDNLLGVIEKVTLHASMVKLITSKSSSFTAQTSKTNALGVVKGLGNGEIVLDNVILSDTLEVGDVVLTKGDESLAGNGVVPGLVVGKIVAVDKNPSAIFQKASVKSIVTLEKLPEVFVLLP